MSGLATHESSKYLDRFFWDRPWNTHPSPGTPLERKIVTGLHYPSSLMTIYPPLYPQIDLYPALQESDAGFKPLKLSPPIKPGSMALGYPSSIYCIYPAVYPHLDIYPAIQRHCSSGKKPTYTTAVTSSPLQSPSLGYPSSIYSTYPAVYPHLDIYPTIQTCGFTGEKFSHAGATPAETRCVPQSLGYVSSIYTIYPGLYPHFDIYPTLQTCRSPVDHATESPKPISASQSLGYPSSIYCIYPTQYPNFNLYPRICRPCPSSSRHKPAPLRFVQQTRAQCDEEWVATPPSPDRLPSVGLISRLQTPEDEESFFAFRQREVSMLDSFRPLASSPHHLIERSFETEQVSLADASLPSPLVSQSSEPGNAIPEDNSSMSPMLNSTLDYPSRLYCIYPALYPIVTVYPFPGPMSVNKKAHPALQLSTIKQTTSSSASCSEYEWPVTPPSPDRLPSVGLASRLQTPWGEESFSKEHFASSYHNEEYYFIDPEVLVRQATDVAMVPLALASQPSPPLSPTYGNSHDLMPPSLQVSLQLPE